MKKIIFLVFFSLVLVGASSAQEEAKVVRLPDLMKVIESPGSGVKVINFWATWCGPCVKELPMFEKVNKDRKDVEVTLVSMDMVIDPNPAKVHKFIARKKLASKVLILDETDQNAYIDAIDKQWSGALPATIVINSKTGKRKFVGQELKEGELEKLIDQVQ